MLVVNAKNQLPILKASLSLSNFCNVFSRIYALIYHPYLVRMYNKKECLVTGPKKMHAGSDNSSNYIGKKDEEHGIVCIP